MLSEGLNPQQASAVFFNHANDGAALVLAGAGSGKTTVLTRRAAYLAVQNASAGILGLTFTAEAAREMEGRVRALLRGAAVEAFPELCTFHAFAFRLIRSEFAGEANWRRLGFASDPVLLEPDRRRAWLAAAARSLACDDHMDALERRVARPFTAAAAADRGFEAPADVLRERFRAFLLETGAVAFDDMVTLALRLLRAHPGVLADLRARIGHVLVDEFQDTSPDQLDLVGLIDGGRGNVFLVGDDDQSIYGFRGADPGNFTRALAGFPGMKILKLETNYRSSAPIVAFANAIFADKPGHLRKHLRPGRPLPGAAMPVKTFIHREGLQQARWLAGEIERLRRDEGLDWEHIAILFRINALEPYYRSLAAHLLGEAAAAGLVFKTVHGSKGLQYPAVFFVGLEDGILPYRRAGEARRPEADAEEKRIFYVGVTRAERFLYLCACRRRVLRGKARDFAPSPFLPGRATGILRRLAVTAKLPWGARRRGSRNDQGETG